ncbi:SoxR-reducing system protein RseC [Dickeya lacustris]|uniref:SoxR-reducing system protein RseC n=1 Tax=Dickeya lacustris TaxID=2259638 RepID=A0ABY8GAQ4_9GAMM|nr:SoxR-reducing system protein RseC [Dickeya lacustris]WFN56934.1 SoxR-reducing system protein RseC [Dickeya lacustris]
MIKEWATVESWQDGVVVLRCEQQSGCQGCQSRSSCGNGVLSKVGGPVVHQLSLRYPHPLQPGQRVEIGLAEASLLRSAMLVYLVPLLGLMLGAMLFQYWLTSELAAVTGALLGISVSFGLLKYFSPSMANNPRYQPVILQVALVTEPRSAQHTGVAAS